MTNHIDQAIDALVNDDRAAALGHLMLHKLELVEEIKGKPKPKPVEDLPPAKPVDGKRLKSIDVPCPTCKAKPGKKCFRLTSRGPHGVPTDELLPGYHSSRSAKMKVVS